MIATLTARDRAVLAEEAQLTVIRARELVKRWGTT